MKKLFFGIIIGLLAGGVGVWLFLHHGAAEHDAGTEEKNNESHVQHGENDKVFLKLDKEFQSHADLKISVLEAAEMKPEIRAFGRVMDAAPLATTLHDMAAGRAQVEASAKEAERLNTLFAQNQNASARALETAQATLKRDQLALQAAQLRLLTSWGKTIASRPDLDALAASLVAQEIALIRIDVPASEKMSGMPTGARLALLNKPDAPVEAEFLGPALAADAQTLGQSFIFLAKAKSLPVNAPVQAWLSVHGDIEKGVIVPRDAIVRHAGETFVYVQTTENTFERMGIALHQPLTAGWFCDELKPGVKVVINGAQQLLSEEFKGAGGEE